MFAVSIIFISNLEDSKSKYMTYLESCFGIISLLVWIFELKVHCHVLLYYCIIVFLSRTINCSNTVIVQLSTLNFTTKNDEQV